MKLSIVIVSYNVKYYLGQCLLSVKRAIEGIDAEVIVVDNHSKDGSVEYIKKIFPWVTCISSLHNLGFARANNLAMQQTNSDYVLLLNPDTFIGENTINDTLGFMDNHKSIGGLGVTMLTTIGQRAKESRRGFPSPLVSFYKMMGLCDRFPNHPKFGHYYMSNMSWDKPGKIEVISGAFFLIRHAALDKVGLLDEDFFMYGEDIDLSYRLLKGGFENWFFPTKILHYKGESTQRSSFRYVHVFYAAMFIFFRKHYSSMSFLLSIPIKIAIYLKATSSLFQMLCNKSRKLLGFIPHPHIIGPNYIFIGNKNNIDRCREIVKNRGVTGKYVIGNKHNLPNGHLDKQELIEPKILNYIVYDMDAYSYEDVLSIFAVQPQNNVHIGTYNRHTDCVITENEILK